MDLSTTEILFIVAGVAVLAYIYFRKPVLMTKGNDGYQTCDNYCGGINGGPWNNELPRDWNGATCVKTGIDGIGCKDVPVKTIKNIHQINCYCTPDGKGWNK